MFHVTRADAALCIAHKMDWISYHRLDDIYGYLNYLAATYPNLVELINIGTSYENRSLYLVRISNATTPDSQPAVWIDGGIVYRLYTMKHKINLK